MAIPTPLLEPAAALRRQARSTSETPDAAHQGPILLGTSGDRGSDAAVRMAGMIAGRTGGGVRVVSAVEALAPIPGAPEVLRRRDDLPRLRERALREYELRRQLERVMSRPPEWGVRVEEGRAEEVLARIAAETDARLVVVGRGRHGLVGRLVNGEHVPRMLRTTDVPVYAVDAAARTLARHVVVGMDFSPHSMRAAVEALAVIAPDAVVTLAHVWPRAGALTSWERSYEAALPGLLDAARLQLGAPDSMRVETVTLVGYAPGAALSEYARAFGADLVVSSTRGHGPATRLAIGSVASELLRSAHCSFLCVPATPADVHEYMVPEALPHIPKPRLF